MTTACLPRRAHLPVLGVLLLSLALTGSTSAQVRGPSGEIILGFGGLYAVAYSPDGRYIATAGNLGAFLWDAETGAHIRTFSGHTDNVGSVALSPDGKRVLTGSWDNTAKLWDAETGQELRTFSGHTWHVNSVAFSPDGKQVLTGSEDDTAKLWDVETGQEICTLSGHISAVYSVAFSPGGTRVLTGSSDDTAKLWDAEAGQEICTFVGHTSGVSSVAFSPDGKRVLTGSWDRTAKLWDAGTGQLLRTFYGHSDWLRSVAFSPDGKRVLTGSEDATAKLWDAETGQEIRTLSGHTDWVYFVAFSPDGKRVLTGSRDCTAKLWDAETGQVIRTFSGHAHMIVSVAFSPDGTQVLVSGSDTALLWDAATGMLLRTLPDWDLAGSFATVWWEGPCWGFSPDGTQVFAGTWDGTVELWDAATGALIRTFSGRASEVLYVAFSPDGTRLLASGGAPTLWDAATGTLLRTFPDRDQFSFGSLLWQGACWGFSPDGAQVFAAAPGGTVELWDAATGALIRTFSAHAPVAFSPDGKRVLTASLDCSTAKLWDAETGQELCTFSGHTWRVNSLAFSPDGTRVLTGSDDRTAKLWDAETGQVIRTFSGHTSEVYSVAFSPDGKRVLTECGFPDDTKLWDAETAQEIRTFSNVHRPASFSPDGTRVLTHYYDGTARIWDISDLSPELPSTATPTGMPVPTPTPTPTSMRPHPRAIAEAYPDTAQEGQHVTLDGSSSIYTYCMEISWSQTRGFPIVAISNSESLTASFIVPAVISATELEFQLTLRDCWGGSPPSFYSSSDRVSVTILPSTITPTATPTPIEEEGVYVFDRPGQLSGDLTGQTDFDPVDTRNLTIYWNAPQGAATDWHIYIRKGLGGMRYLGRTGSGTVTNLDWYSGAPGLGEEFRNGPDFNSVYVFRLIRIDGKLGPDDYFDPGGPVGFNLEGGNPVSLSQPAMPNLEAGQICIYDDILGGNDLAPVGSIGSDTDDPGCRAIQIAWNFGADTSTVNMYHVQVSVNNGDFEYLGQTGSGDITYFWWTPTNEFNTAPSYASGPEGGRTYQFRVVLLPLSGPQDTLTSGKLMYSVTED